MSLVGKRVQFITAHHVQKGGVRLNLLPSAHKIDDHKAAKGGHKVDGGVDSGEQPAHLFV